MLAAFDFAPAADDGGRQWIVIVHVAVAHVAAENNDRMIQHGAVAVGHFREFGQEPGKDLGVIGLDFDQCRHPLGIVEQLMNLSTSLS